MKKNRCHNARGGSIIQAPKNTVMFLCDYASVYGGNFIPSLMALEAHLNKQDVRSVYVFPEECRDRGWIKELQSKEKRIDFFDFRSSRIKIIKRLLRLLDEYEITILHTHFCFVLGVELVSLFRPGLMVFIHLHSDFTAGRRSIKNRISDRLLCAAPPQCKFICVSEKDAYINPKKSYYLPNALAMERIPVNHRSGKQFRAELGIQDETCLVEAFGWSPFVKGVDIAVQAIGKLNHEGINVCLMVVCGRNCNKSAMMDFIQKTTQYSGNERFIYYVEPIEDVFCYHEAADICLSSSRSETFSYAILEMLSIGKRCVVSDIEGTKWSTRFQSVLPFESENVESCAQAIKKAIEQSANQRINDEDKKKIQADYNIERWVKSIIKIYGI